MRRPAEPAGGTRRPTWSSAEPIEVTAASDVDASATVNGVAVGAISLAALIPTAWATAATRAFAGDGTNVHATSLNLLADSETSRRSRPTEAIAIGLASGNGGSAEAIVASDTEAYLGERFDTTRLAQADVQIRDLAGNRGTVNIDAISGRCRRGQERRSRSIAHSRRQRPPADCEAVGFHPGVHRASDHPLRRECRRPGQGRRGPGNGDCTHRHRGGPQHLGGQLRCQGQPDDGSLRRPPREPRPRHRLPDADCLVAPGSGHLHHPRLHRRCPCRCVGVLDQRRRRPDTAAGRLEHDLARHGRRHHGQWSRLRHG